MNKKNIDRRSENFERNQMLENLLTEINKDLWVAEEELLKTEDPNFPVVFIVGPMRSGTTLMMQWLASSGLFSYPTNLLSRFYKAPIMGAKLQLLLTDERYNFRDELKDFASEIDFSSDNGKTKGVLAPNEFWYFWRRFVSFKELDYLSTEQLLKESDTKTLVAEFAGMMDVFQKPMALKAMILNYNIDFLDQLFEKAIFIHMKRDPLTNIASVLNARERQLGGIEQWYSFKIPEYNELKNLNPYEQVAGQIHYMNKAVKKGLAGVTEYKKITVNYEEFCENPRATYDILCKKLKENGYNTSETYKEQEAFTISREKVDNENILNAFKIFC